ncbi:MAG: SseB family protein [Nocardioidaceae bacterium]
MRSLSAPGFSGDTGSSDPKLAEALAAYEFDRVDGPVLVALSGARLLVPVVTVAGEVDGADGATSRAARMLREKSADVAAVLLQRGDGRRALLSFTGLEALQAWDSSARPVPAATRDTATAAVAQGADALLVDLAGPVRYVVAASELRHLAAGHRLAATSAGYVWVEAG